MTRTLSRNQARELDRRAVAQYGMSAIMLMENAGRGVADLLVRLGISGPVIVCCGRGNNGGDGFVAARHLDLRGVHVRVLLFDDPAGFKGDAAINYHVLAKSGVAIRQISPADLDLELANARWIVDGLLGTGAMGEPRAPYDQVIAAINARRDRASVLAIDLPSGLDCDTGAAARHTIRAHHTCTFVAEKPGFLAPSARHFTGQVHVVDIGAPRKLVEEILGKA
jgi:NAD(P)H-hydrate epimerase